MTTDLTNDDRGQLPQGWLKCPLGDVLTLVNGRAYRQHEMLDAGTPILRIQNLNGGKNWFYSDLNLPDDKYCEAGDLLYAWSATFGPYLWKGQKAIFHYHIWNVKETEVIDRGFMYYVLHEITNAVKAASHGVAMPHMTKSGMEAWLIPLPPLPEQIRIADKLDALLSRVEAGRERLERVPGLLKRFRQSVLSAAVSGDEVEFQPLREMVAEPLRNGKSVRDGEGKRVLRLSCLKADGVDWDEAKSGDWTGLDFQRFIVREGDFLISRGNGSLNLVGRGALAASPPEAIAFPDTLIRVRPNLAVLLPAYLNLIWQTEPVRQQIQAAAKTTAGIFKVSQGDLEVIEIPLPPLPEQAEIVRRVEALFAIADRIEARYGLALTTFNRLTPALLAKAFRGELVPQDPNDEPALVLLERIRAQRAATGEQPKRGRGAAKGAAKAASSPDGAEPKRRGRPPKARADAPSAAPAIAHASSYEDAVRRLEAQKMERAQGSRQISLFGSQDED